ncbi:hypothetical protein PsYK624_013160 [Phanerochaete sordida]|uniref:Uncharacterized protein n=1 Tax=Phanerochaete sordida TaxID=48140 RepID=A0A9P3FZ39_9APHY|nr:hypothetical protein PsYK624_013160 [Phanerochaete sordida]
MGVWDPELRSRGRVHARRAEIMGSTSRRRRRRHRGGSRYAPQSAGTKPSEMPAEKSDLHTCCHERLKDSKRYSSSTFWTATN